MSRNPQKSLLCIVELTKWVRPNLKEEIQEIALSREKTEYGAEDCQLIEILGTNFEHRGWAITPTGQAAVHEPILCQIIK